MGDMNRFIDSAESADGCCFSAIDKNRFPAVITRDALEVWLSWEVGPSTFPWSYLLQRNIQAYGLEFRNFTPEVQETLTGMSALQSIRLRLTCWLRARSRLAGKRPLEQQVGRD